MKRELVRIAAAGALAAAACAHPTPPAPDDSAPDATGATPASAATRAANAAFEKLPLGDPGDLEDAQRGLVEQDPDLVIEGPNGRVWDTTVYTSGKL